MHRSGILFIVSGPSGAGKSTLHDYLQKTEDFFYSISCTTRPPRQGEKDGEDYFFIDEALFQQRVRDSYFLEYATVHGYSYGTPLQPIKEALGKGRDILLDIDVQGAKQIRGNPDPIIGVALVDVFLMTQTLTELERRLRKRATDNEQTILRRLAAAREEMSHWREYRYVIFSGLAEEDVRKFRAIMEAERYRTSRLQLDEI